MREFLAILLIVILLFLGFMISLHQEKRLDSIDEHLESMQKVNKRIIEWMEIQELEIVTKEKY